MCLYQVITAAIWVPTTIIPTAYIKMTTGSPLWFVVFAGLGGVVVFVGILTWRVAKVATTSGGSLWLGQADARGCLGRQLEIQSGQQERHVPVRFGASHQQQFPPVGRGRAHVQELQRGEFLEDHAGHQAAGQRLEPLPQGDAQAIRQEGHEEVGFDPVGFVMVNGPQPQVAFQGAEGFLDKHQLHVAAPEPLGVVRAQGWCAGDTGLRVGARRAVSGGRAGR